MFAKLCICAKSLFNIWNPSYDYNCWTYIGILNNRALLHKTINFTINGISAIYGNYHINIAP